MKEIRKSIYFYWGGEKLSYLRYLSIYSFCKYNPHWKVYLYVPYKLTKTITWNTGEQAGEYTGKCWLKECEKLPIDIMEFNMKELSMSNDLPEVIKSDIIRYWLIYNYGGVWSDMDIIYTKPIDLPLNRDIICKHPIHNYYSIGLIGGKRDSKLYGTLIKRAMQGRGSGYQDYGNGMWYNLDTTKCYNLPMNKIYALDSSQIPNIYSKGTLNEKSIGCHWYAGHPLSKEWENKITKDNYDYNNVICDCIKKVLDNDR